MFRIDPSHFSWKFFKQSFGTAMAGPWSNFYCAEEQNKLKLKRKLAVTRRVYHWFTTTSHFPVWPCVTMNYYFLLVCEVISAFEFKLSALIVWSVLLNQKFLTCLCVSVQNCDLYFINVFDAGIVLGEVCHGLPRWFSRILYCTKITGAGPASKGIGGRFQQYLVFKPDNGLRVVNGPHFKAGTRPEPEITSPFPGRHRHLIFKPDLGPKAKFTKWVEICATTGSQKT